VHLATCERYDQKPANEQGANVPADGKGVTLEIAEPKPTWCMEIKYNNRGADGSVVESTIHGTIHPLGE